MKKNVDNLFLKKKASQIRKIILTMAYRGNRANISSSLSITELLVVLYWNFLNVQPKKSLDPKRDRFILSKGHAVAALYAVLCERQFFPKEKLSEYGKNNSDLGAHPERGTVSGIETSTGSLGHGLGVGAGMALAGKIDNQTYRVVTLLSDAECQEGSIWEAALFCGQNKLSNMIAIIDYNNMQAFGRVEDISDLQPIAPKWKSFRWNVVEVDGNNVNEISKALAKLPHPTKPTVIIAYTISGKGVSFMENKLEWHYLNLTEDLYQKAMKEQAI